MNYLAITSVFVFLDWFFNNDKHNIVSKKGRKILNEQIKEYGIRGCP
jgi:hypothetical protein